MQTVAVLTGIKVKKKERKGKEILIYLTVDKSFADTTLKARL